MSSDTTIVCKLRPSLPLSTIQWIIDRFTSARPSTGIVFSARVQATSAEHSESVILLSPLEESCFINIAIRLNIRKIFKDGTLREITTDSLADFPNSNDQSFFTSAEKQRMILFGLESIRAADEQTKVDGLDDVSLFRGQAIVPKLIESGVIQEIFPLHDIKGLRDLRTEWCAKFLKGQPFDAIRSYFGENITMYFAFLHFYTICLTMPAILSLIYVIFPIQGLSSFVFFCTFNIIWATIFLEFWKRKSSVLSYQWGTWAYEEDEQPRPEYHGDLRISPITGSLEPHYPTNKRLLRLYGVSLPVVLMCLTLAALIMRVYFALDSYCQAVVKLHGLESVAPVFTLLPTIAYSVVIVVLNGIYRRLAKFLTDKENHRLKSQYNNQLIVKLVVFDSVNCFLWIFYIAFVLGNLNMLRKSLATLLITQQILAQFTEVFLPYLSVKVRKRTIRKQLSGDASKTDITQTETVEMQALIESQKDVYMEPLDDYLELFIQFGYVFLFSAVFPPAALCALINNITEIRSDAFKLTHNCQRPFTRPTSSIGVWQIVFEAVAALAVVTNCALLAMSPEAAAWRTSLGDAMFILIFVGFEHLLLLAKVLLALVIPDKPLWVTNAILKIRYQSKKALLLSQR